MAEKVRIAVGETPPPDGDRFNGLYLLVGDQRVQISGGDAARLGVQMADAARRTVNWREDMTPIEVIFECEATVL